MPTPYSGNNTISDGPFDLVNDGEQVNYDSTMQSGTAAKGLFARVFNALSWLKKRRAIYVSYSTDGAGGVTMNAVSKGIDGVTADFSAAAIAGSHVLLTFATALPSAAYVVCNGGATIGYTAHAVTKNAGNCTITVADGASGATVNQSTTIVQVDLVIFHPG